MQFENLGCLYSFAVFAGFLLSLAWLGVYLLSWLWAWTWSWIDDSKAPRRNPLINQAMKIMGWGHGDWLWSYRKGCKNSDGERGFFFPLLAFLLGPTILLSALVAYPLTIAIASSFAIAHLARFARRHKKLFDKHIKDPDAHK